MMDESEAVREVRARDATHLDLRDHKRLAQVEAGTPVLDVADDVCAEPVTYFAFTALVCWRHFWRAVEVKVDGQSRASG